MDELALPLLLAHLGSTGLMAGLIWFVQIVHYPLHAAVPAEAFVAYEREHVARTGRLVGPLMLVEAATVVALLVRPPDGLSAWMPGAGAGLLALLWISTFLVQVPMHRRLERGADVATVRRLVASNWIRTAAWSLRFGLAAWMLVAFLGAAEA